MVTFLSVFLGLVLGVQPVQLQVSEDVAKVELRLDGRSVGHMSGQPWTLALDFGPELSPHELTAIGFDGEGREVARSTLLINQPQPRSRVELVRDDSSPSKVGLVWHSADRLAPDSWQVRFGGQDLDVSDPRDFELPAFDADLPHLLQATLHFGPSSARIERILGGPSGDEIDTELTAYMIVTEDGQPPPIDKMQGWLTKRGEPLEIVTVERGGSDIVLVQEATPRMWGALNRLRSEALLTRNRSFLNARLTSGLHSGDRLRVLLPVGERSDLAALEQFPISHDFAAIKLGPVSVGAGRRLIGRPEAEGILATFPYPPEGALREDAPRRTADAVAVAAQAAVASRRARAVVLVRDPEAQDSSEHRAELVRHYLEKLQVPLLVWSPDPDVRRSDHTSPWGRIHDIATFQKLQRAVLQLRESLDRQWVVWVRGRHLAHEIDVSPAARGYFAGLLGGLVSPAASGEGTLPEETAKPALSIAETEPGGLKSPVPLSAPETPSAPQLETAPREAVFSEIDTTEIQVKTRAKSIDSIDGERAPTLVEAVDVRLVNVEVSVSDGEGRPVRDLTATDFELRVDGESVDISHFVPPLGTPGASPEEAREREAPGSDDTRVIVFLDASRLDVSGRRQLAASLQATLGTSPPSSTMVVTYDRSLKIPMSFSADPNEARAVFAELEDGGLQKAVSSDRRHELAGEMARVEAALLQADDATEKRMAESRRSALLALLRAETQTLASETRETLRAMEALVSGLGALEGRKVLLYAGAGLELTPSQELYAEAAETLQLEPREVSSLLSESSSFRLHGPFARLTEKANAAGVTLYSVVPPARHAAGVAERSALSLSRPGAQMRLPSARLESLREGSCLITETSGGACQIGGEPQRLLDQMMADLKASYVLAFSPPQSAGGTHHSLDVEVLGHPALDVRHRQSYRSREKGSEPHERLTAALYFGSEDNGLGMSVRTGEPKPSPSGLQLVPIIVRLPVARLGFSPLEGGDKLGARARLLIASRSSEGEVRGLQEFPIAFQVDTDRLERQPQLAYEHEAHLMLEPGQHTVAIGWWDEVSHVGSFLSREVSTADDSS